MNQKTNGMDLYEMFVNRIDETVLEEMRNIIVLSESIHTKGFL